MSSHAIIVSTAAATSMMKLESDENQEFDLTRKWLEQARNSTPSPRFWMKGALLEWCLDNLDRAKALLEEGLKLYPDFDKFYMMFGQIHAQQGNLDEACAFYTEGVKRSPHSIPLWLLLIRLEEEEARGQPNRARSLLDVARTKNPRCDLLWLEAVRMEARAGQKELAQSMLARALQECEHSGLLWAEAIFMEQQHPTRQEMKIFDALKRCEYDPHVLLAGARLVWAMATNEKTRTNAREWFERTVAVEPDFGDAWAYFYKFELLHGTQEQQNEVRARCVQAEPRHGDVWVQASKDVRNWLKETEELLELVANKLEIPK